MNLEPQEIRHSLYQGRSTKLIEQMAAMPSFRTATQYSLTPDRMVDREYALRYIAFTEIDYEKRYKGNVDDYLIAAMKQINQADDDTERRILSEFKRTMEICHNVFKEYAFRRYVRAGSKYRRGPINKALFETWSVCLRNMPDTRVELILDNRDAFIESYGNFLADEKYSLALRAGDEFSVKRRMDMTRSFLKEFFYAYKNYSS
jgi:hypothetical protein